jgi:hypothetical protein
MKKLLIVIFIVTIGMPNVYASVCTDLGNVSEKIMESRQINVPITDMMKLAENFNAVNEQWVQIVKSITIDAYSLPRFTTVQYQKDAIRDFRNKWETMCYRNRNK